MNTSITSITGKTRVVGVIGHPVGHSLSPAMHNAAFQATGLDYCYVAFDVEPDSLPGALQAMRSLGIRGLNVTIPHKPAAFALVDQIAPSALAVGAVNTIQLKDGQLIGHNTDGEGFARSLEQAGVPIRGRRVVLLGAGGAARSVAAACLERGAARLTILNRRPEKAEELARRLEQAGLASNSDSPRSIKTGTLLGEEPSVRSAEIIVQCTPVGMSPATDVPPPIPGEWIPAEAVVYDLIYNPAETRFLAAARAEGARVINGVEMLVYQGAVAFQIWTGVFPPLDVMRNALLAGLRQPSPAANEKRNQAGSKSRDSGARV